MAKSNGGDSLEEIGQILSRIGKLGSFAARRTAAARDLRLEVKGVGPLKFPLSQQQSRQLVAVGRPAR